MLSLENLKEFTKKYQTRVENIKREYLQHLFLSFLYQLENSEKLLFKGGTALRFVFGSPRFSEDLDFTGQNIHLCKIIDELFIQTIHQVEKVGINITFKEAKPTSGGYLGVIHYTIYDFSENMKFEVSLRKSNKAKYEITTLVNDYTIAYPVICLPTKKIVHGKISALLNRGKPRDYYDLYFILRHPEMRKYINPNSLKLTLENLKNTRINFKEELSVLLPASHQMLLKNFRQILLQEITKYI
jgi:predicted nucleotidyltransferase component of viral defense system